MGLLLTRDPIKDGRNWYVYCGNNPSKWVDPEGTDWHNPTRVKLDPKFKGNVTIGGEWDPNKKSATNLPPGYASHPHMDVDYLIITQPDGPIQYWFVPGAVGKGRHAEYSIDEDGDVHSDTFNFPPQRFFPGLPWWPNPMLVRDMENDFAHQTPKRYLPRPVKK